LFEVLPKSLLYSTELANSISGGCQNSSEAVRQEM